jgi:hypothetical protein
MRANHRVLVIEKVEKRKQKIGNDKWDRYLDDYNNYVKEYNIHYLNVSTRATTYCLVQ